MKSVIIALLILCTPFTLQAQGDILCQYYVGKKKVFIEIANNTLDTIELDFSTLQNRFWDHPVLLNDYLFKGDTLFLDIAPDTTVNFSCGEITYYMDGQRITNTILPFQSFSFYIKIPEAAYVKTHINHIGILGAPPFQRMLCERLRYNTIVFWDNTDYPSLRKNSIFQETPETPLFPRQ